MWRDEDVKNVRPPSGLFCEGLYLRLLPRLAFFQLHYILDKPWSKRVEDGDDNAETHTW